MADIVFKIDHNKILYKTVAGQQFCSGNKANNIWRYYFYTSEDSNVYIAIANITKSGTLYKMPLLVSKNQNAVKFYVTLNGEQQQTSSTAGGSFEYGNEVFYYNKFLMPMQSDAVVYGDFLQYSTPVDMPFFTENDVYMEKAARLMLEDEGLYTFTKRELLNIEHLCQSNITPNQIFYGVVPDSGSVELLDIDNKILNLVNTQQITNKPIDASIYINDNLFAKAKTAGKPDYDVNEKKLKLKLTSKFINVKNIKYNRPFISNKIRVGSLYEYPNDVSVYNLIVDLISETGLYTNPDDTAFMFSDSTQLQDYTIGTLANYLQSLIIEYPYINSSNALEAFNKLCQIGQVNLIEDAGRLRLINSRPIIAKNAIIIPKSKQYGVFKYSVILDNKYDNIKISSTVFNNEYKEIYSSDKLFVTQNRDYIGNDAGVNDEKYDVYGSDSSPNYWFQFNYHFNAKDVDYILDFRSNSNDDYFDVKATESRKIYIHEDTLPVNDYTQDEERDINFDYTSTAISYHQPYLQDNKIINVFNYTKTLGGDNDGDIDIRCQINWYEHSEYAAGTIFSYSWTRDNYIENFYFKIRCTAYSLSDYIVSFGSGDNYYTVNNNELFQYNYDGDNSAITKFSNNILSDYKNGISDGVVTVSYGDYYDENGNKIIDSEKGGVFKVGDIVKIEGSDKTWKITGRKLRKKGVIFIDLEVSEVNPPVIPEIVKTFDLTKCSMELTRVSSNVDAAEIGLIPSDSVIYIGDVIKIKIVPEYGAQLQELTINGISYTNDSQYTVSSDIDLIAVCFGYETIYNSNLYVSSSSDPQEIQSITMDGLQAPNSDHTNYIRVTDGIFSIYQDSELTAINRRNGYSLGAGDIEVSLQTLLGDYLYSNNTIYIDLVLTSDLSTTVGTISFTLLEQEENTFKFKNTSYNDEYSSYIGRIKNCKVEQYK